MTTSKIKGLISLNLGVFTIFIRAKGRAENTVLHYRDTKQDFSRFKSQKYLIEGFVSSDKYRHDKENKTE